jgi:hypothetical protein
MPTTISGTTGVSQCQPGSVSQDDLAANVVGNGPAFSAYQTGTAQVLASNTWNNVITLGAKEYDTANNFNVSTYRFTPTVAGYYQINAGISIVSDAKLVAGIFKNGSVAKYGTGLASGTTASVSAVIQMNGTTDYIELRGYSNTTATLVDGPASVYFQGVLVRAA